MEIVLIKQSIGPKPWLRVKHLQTKTLKALIRREKKTIVGSRFPATVTSCVLAGYQQALDDLGLMSQRHKGE